MYIVYDFVIVVSYKQIAKQYRYLLLLLMNENDIKGELQYGH